MAPKALTEEVLKKLLREDRELLTAQQENFSIQVKSQLIAVRKQVQELSTQPLGSARAGPTRTGARAAVLDGSWKIGLNPFTLANVKGLTSASGVAAQCTQFLAASRLNALMEGSRNADSNWNLLKGIVCFCHTNQLGTFPLGQRTPKPRRTPRPAAHTPPQPAPMAHAPGSTRAEVRACQRVRQWTWKSTTALPPTSTPS